MPKTTNPKPRPQPQRRRRRGDFIRTRDDGSFYNDASLEPSNHTPNRQWAVDYDYLAQLSEAEREWLADFTSAHYDADFRRVPKEDWPLEARRVANASKWASRQDHYAYLNTGGMLRDVDARTDGGARRYEVALLPSDQTPTPEYQNSDSYKHALAAYRATLVPGKLPQQTPEHLAALARLRAVTPDPPTDTEDPHEDPKSQPPRSRPGPSKRPAPRRSRK